MIELIYGGSASGKSEYAEERVLALSAPEERFYIATMAAFGEEGKARIERHRKLRSGKGFRTIERKIRIIDALSEMEDPENACILIEDISNLVANEMFSGPLKEERIAERITGQLRFLCGKVRHAVLVSNNIFDEAMLYEETTGRYAGYLGRINAALADFADEVIEVVAGIGLRVK